MIRKRFFLVFISALGLGGASAQQPGRLATGTHPMTGKSARVYVTAANTAQRLAPAGSLVFEPLSQLLETHLYVLVDPNHAFQTLLGIGGALTDASAETFARLPKSQQQEVLRAYYSPTDGIGYTLARTSIHSSDFSSASYTYVAAEDETLKTFSVQHDEQFRIPFIKQALAASGGQLKLFVTPWSPPPAWMKDNHDILHGGKLLPQYRQAWASYYVKFIKAYEQRGIPVWGLSVQNEPLASQKWESCVFTGEEERDFIKGYLGPALAQSGLGSKKLIAWDHNRDLVYPRASAVLDDSEAAKYVWGIGYHWYETWTGTTMLFDNVRRVHETYPKTNLLLTEACVDRFSPDQVENWTLGERYGMAMIGDFNAGAVGWTDWNVLLDETGGPNHVGNFCFAPIIGDTKVGKLRYTNAYYSIGHFSRFIRPGARRIVSSANRDALQATAFRNPDGSVVVVMNHTDKALDFQLWLAGQSAKTTAAAHSIMTIVQ